MSNGVLVSVKPLPDRLEDTFDRLVRDTYIRPNQADQRGFAVNHYGRPGSKDPSKPGQLKIEGQRNGDQPQEKIDLILSLSDQDPSNPNFQFAALEIAGMFTQRQGQWSREVSWWLNDLNPTTSFDQTIRRRVDRAILKAKTILSQQGITPHRKPEDYQKLLGIALSYFVDAPPLQRFSNQKAGAPNPRDQFYTNRNMHLHQWLDNLKSLRTDDGKVVDLSEFGDFIINHGGLGTSIMNPYSQAEHTALTAIYRGEGDCSEQVRVLASVWRRAGLKFQIAFAKKPDYQEAVFRATGKRPLSNDHHVFLGLVYGNNKAIYLDPSNMTFFGHEAKYENFYILNWRQFLAWEKTNQAIHTSPERAIVLLEEAQFLDPQNPYVYANLSHQYLGLRAQTPQSETKTRAELLKRSLANAKKSLSLDPQNPFAWERLGAGYALMEDYSQARKYANKAKSLDAAFAPAYGLLGYIALTEGKLATSQKERNAKWSEAEAQISLALQYNPNLATALTNRRELNQLRSNQVYSQAQRQPAKTSRQPRRHLASN